MTPQSHGICGLCAALASEHIDTFDVVAIPGARHRVALYPVVSDNLSRAGWRDCGGTVGVLVLRFKGNASLFVYSNVTRTWWEAFWKAESKGGFFHTTVRADKFAHPFVKL